MSNVIKMKRLTADEEHWYVDLSLEPSQMVFRKTVYLSNPADARKWSYVDKDTKAMYEKKAKPKKLRTASTRRGNARPTRSSASTSSAVR